MRMLRLLSWILVLSPALAVAQFWVITSLQGGRDAGDQLNAQFGSLATDFSNSLVAGGPTEIAQAMPELPALTLAYAVMGVVAILVMMAIPRIVGTVAALVATCGLTAYVSSLVPVAGDSGPLMFVAPVVAVLFNAMVRAALRGGRIV